MLHKKGWERVISPDTHVEHVHGKTHQRNGHFVIFPGELLVPVSLKEQYHIPRPLVAESSTRSVGARNGIIASFSEEQMREMIEKGKTPKTIFVSHHGIVPFLVKPGDAFLRWYLPFLPRSLKRAETLELLKRKELVLESFHILGRNHSGKNDVFSEMPEPEQLKLGRSVFSAKFFHRFFHFLDRRASNAVF